jgi:AraC-like DNA-binding protein
MREIIPEATSMRVVATLSSAAVTDPVLEAVHAPILQCFPELVSELGGDPAFLLGMVGIDLRAIGPGQSHLSYRQMADLLELTAVALDCSDFGMRLASRQSSGDIFGPLGEAMRHSKTFGDALEIVAEHKYAHSLAAGTWLKPSRSGTSVMLGHDIVLDGLPVKSQVMEQILLLGHLLAIRLTGGMVRARRIHFRHQPISPMRSYRAHFGCEIRFGQSANGTLYYDSDLRRPIIAANPAGLRSAIAVIQTRFRDREPSISVLVRGAIMHFLDADRCHNDKVAQVLNLHPRTLQRRLKMEGTSVRRIVHEVRRDLMSYYIQQTDLDFSGISGRLGFSEQSVFTRFCRKWFSLSPSQLRLQSRSKREHV